VSVAADIVTYSRNVIVMAKPAATALKRS